MLSRIKNLFSHTLIYGIGSTAGRFAGFLLIPVYTRYLSTSDYGILSLLYMMSSFLFIFLNMGMSSAIFKSYFHADNDYDKKTVTFTALTTVMIICLSILSVSLFCNTWISNIIVGSKDYGNLIALVICVTNLNVVLRIPFALLRAKEKSKAYMFWSLLKVLLSIFFSITLVVFMRRGVNGVFEGEAIALSIILMILFYYLVKDIHFRFSWKIAKEMLNYGIPLVPAGIAIFVITLSDRFFIRHYCTLHDVGIYSLGYKFGEIMGLMAMAVQLAWPTFLFSNEKTPYAQELYSRTTTYYIAAGVFIWLLLSTFGPEIIALMAKETFYEAYRIIPFIALSYLLSGLAYIASVGLFLKNKTKYMALYSGAGAIINLALNYILIPRYGILGAAIATVMSYALQMVLAFTISMRFYNINYEVARILKIVIPAVAIYFCSTYSFVDSFITIVCAKTIVVLLYPAALYLLGFFNKEELYKVRSIYASLRQNYILSKQ
jgi:O-antigen/teichoic acid export membrane protein